MDDAILVARRILAGDLDPNLGCGLIAAISKKLRFPSVLDGFAVLSHEQAGHEHVGITAESCIPDILAECRKLVGERV